jgi:hypothetical protein
MGYRVLRIHTPHDDLEFKTRESKVLFDNLLTHLETLRNEPTGGSIAATPSPDFIADQIKKLGELHKAGLLTDDEFNAKKKQLLARL